jgi:hypothetical protein
VTLAASSVLMSWPSRTTSITGTNQLPIHETTAVPSLVADSGHVHQIRRPLALLEAASQEPGDRILYRCCMAAGLVSPASIRHPWSTRHQLCPVAVRHAGFPYKRADHATDPRSAQGNDPDPQCSRRFHLSRDVAVVFSSTDPHFRPGVLRCGR